MQHKISPAYFLGGLLIDKKLSLMSYGSMGSSGFGRKSRKTHNKGNIIFFIFHIKFSQWFMIDRHARCIYMSGKISCFTSNHFLNYLIFFSLLTAQPASAHLLKKKATIFWICTIDWLESSWVGRKILQIVRSLERHTMISACKEWIGLCVKHENTTYEQKKVCCLSSHSNSFSSWLLEFLFARLSGSFLIALNWRLERNAQFNTP